MALSILQEASVLLEIVKILNGLTHAEQARVLLTVALKMAPDAFSPDEYQRLVEAAKEPRQLTIPTVSIVHSHDVGDDDDRG